MTGGGLLARIPALAVGAMLLIAHPPDAQSDGLAIAFFTIEHDPAAGVLNIVHTFDPAGLAIGLSRFAGQPVRIDASADFEATARNYIEARFGLQTNEGRPIIVKWQGMESRAGALLVRQAATLPKDADGIVVRNVILMDAHPEQLNVMRARIAGLTFKRDFLSGGAAQRLMIR